MKRIVSVMLACIMALALLAGCGSKGSGKKISFEGTDLNGNTVTSSEIFGNNKVTMVNLWSSTCKGCEDELAQLQDLGDRVAGAGGQVIGVIMDTDMDNAVEKCSAKLQSHGATYTNVVATAKMREDLATNVYPLTYFVDSEGNVLDSVTGNLGIKTYEDKFKSLLGADFPASTMQPAENSSGSTENSSGSAEGSEVAGSSESESGDWMEDFMNEDH